LCPGRHTPGFPGLYVPGVPGLLVLMVLFSSWPATMC